jgi:hypothetical protein
MTPQEETEARPVIHDFVEWMVWFLDRCIKLDDPFPGFRLSRKRALIRWSVVKKRLRVKKSA